MTKTEMTTRCPTCGPHHLAGEGEDRWCVSCGWPGVRGYMPGAEMSDDVTTGEAVFLLVTIAGLVALSLWSPLLMAVGLLAFPVVSFLYDVVKGP